MNKFIYIAILTSFLACKSSKEVSKKETTRAGLSEAESMTLHAMFVDANKEKILGNETKAVMLFQKCTEIDPKNHAAYFELSKLHSNLKNMPLFDYKRALVYAQKAYALSQENTWYIEHLALLYELNGKTSDAIGYYQKLIGIKPYNIEYYAKLGDLYESTKKYKEAIEMYHKIETLTGISDVTSFKKSDLYLVIGENQKAIDELEKLIAYNPNQSDYYQKLAECYLKQKNEEGALKTYERLRSIDQTDPNIHLFLSNYYQNKGETDKAFIEMKSAFESRELAIDRKIEILLNYYVISEQKKEYKDQSFELLDLLKKAHPTDAKSFAMAGDFYMRDTNYVKAKENFSKALEIDKTRYPIWNQLLIIDSELKNFEDLAKTSEEAKSYFPTQAIVYYFNGYALSQLKKNEQAAKTLEEGKEFSLDNELLLIQFHSMLGDVYNSLKKFEASDKAFQDALLIDDQNVQVLNNYAYYLSVRKQDLERAKAMSEKTLLQDSTSATYADTYAWILYQNKEYTKALEWMEKAILWDGGNSGTLLEHHGDILYQLGRKQEALESWKKAKKFQDVSEFIDKKIADGILYE